MLVELALVLLPLCLIVFGAVDLGRAYLYMTELRNAARAGAIFAKTSPTSFDQCDSATGYQATGTGATCTPASPTLCADPNNIYYQVASEVSPSSTPLLPANYAITVSDTSASGTVVFPKECGPDLASPSYSSGDTITVEVDAPFTLITPLISAIAGKITFHARVQVIAQCSASSTSPTSTCSG